MEITGSVLTALFVGMAWTLIKVVEYFINSKKKQVPTTPPELIEYVEEISGAIGKIEKCGVLTEKQQQLVENTNDLVKKLGELHLVYDENHVPKWYVPSELLPIVRNIQVSLISLSRELEEGLSDVKDGQEHLATKMIELITTQRLMVERLGDLIGRLDKLVN